MIRSGIKHLVNMLNPETYVQDDSFRLRNIYRVKHGQPDTDDKYIVCADINDLYSGVGCNLKVLAPCWKYALETNRTLIIDWRGNPYTRATPEKNLFSLLYEQPDPSQIGVKCIADDSVNNIRFPQPILAPAGDIPHESGAIDRFPARGRHVVGMRRVIRKGIDVKFPTVMPSIDTTYILASAFGPLGRLKPKMFSFSEAKRLYKSLKLRPQWASMVSEFYESHMEEKPVIGVHIRQGNGEEKYRNHFNSRVIHNYEDFIEAIATRIRRLGEKEFGKCYGVFLCTDSDDVVESMRSFFPLLITRHIWRPSSGEGMDFDHAFKNDDGGLGAAVNAIVDMQLLAKCDIVLMTKWTSFASHVPYIMEKPNAVFYDHKKTARIQ